MVYPGTIQADTMAAHPVLSAPIAAVGVQATASAPETLSITPPNTQTVWVTAYTSDPDETSDHPLITASGGMVRDGVVADNLLPFGTEIEIPALFGAKVFTVEDRTNAKFSGRVDIWMPTYNQALDFGIQKAQIVILDQNLAMK
jgi:3D (Asp-Asp-Asp) domain-containing protein